MDRLTNGAKISINQFIPSFDAAEKAIDPQKEPEKWIRNPYLEFKGGHARATQPITVKKSPERS